MRKSWLFIGHLAFWFSWPGLWLYLRPSHRTRVFLKAGDKVLVTKSWLGDGSWSLPGGGLHKDEPVLDGLIREVNEETGIVLRSADITFVSHEMLNHHGLRCKYDLFTASIAAPLPLRPQPFEIVDTQWIDVVTLANLKIAPDVKTALSKAPPSS